MKLHELRDNPGATKKPKRVGRGPGSGTGKTAAFLISIITDLVDYPLEHKRARGVPRALIIAPTRELALQIEKDAKSLTKHIDMPVYSVLGGIDYQKQKQLWHLLLLLYLSLGTFSDLF